MPDNVRDYTQRHKTSHEHIKCCWNPGYVDGYVVAAVAVAVAATDAGDCCWWCCCYYCSYWWCLVLLLLLLEYQCWNELTSYHDTSLFRSTRTATSHSVWLTRTDTLTDSKRTCWIMPKWKLQRGKALRCWRPCGRIMTLDMDRSTTISTTSHNRAPTHWNRLEWRYSIWLAMYYDILTWVQIRQ